MKQPPVGAGFAQYFADQRKRHFLVMGLVALALAVAGVSCWTIETEGDPVPGSIIFRNGRVIQCEDLKIGINESSCDGRIYLSSRIQRVEGGR